MISRAIAQGFLEVVARHMPDGGEALLPVAGIANVVALLAPGIAREKAAAEGAGHLLLLWQVNEGRVAQEAFFFSWHGGAPLWENWGMGRMAPALVYGRGAGLSNPVFALSHRHFLTLGRHFIIMSILV